MDAPIRSTPTLRSCLAKRLRTGGLALVCISLVGFAVQAQQPDTKGPGLPQVIGPKAPELPPGIPGVPTTPPIPPVAPTEVPPPPPLPPLTLPAANLHPPLRNVEPSTPDEQLVPKAPKTSTEFSAKLPTTLSDVPELSLLEKPEKPAQPPQRNQSMEYLVPVASNAFALDRKKTNGFVKGLLEHRTDMKGLPFLMGDACKTDEKTQPHFRNAAQLITQLASNQVSVPILEADQAPKRAAIQFWSAFRQNNGFLVEVDEDKEERGTRNRIIRARIAALMQILAPQHVAMRKGLVQYLSETSHIEATKALAKLAIYSEEEDLREMAIEKLKLRRQKHYADVLKHGLRYPFPAVAERAAEAITALECDELADELATMLDEADPRAPSKQGGDLYEARALVKINHHRNCFLCHAPIEAHVADPGSMGRSNAPPKFLVAAVPLPFQPMTPPSQGYGSSGQGDLFVRLDVTYLRQDFSKLMPVAESSPWPKMQRFDFLVRKQTLTKDQAASLKKALSEESVDGLSVYQRLAQTTLESLTGKKAKPTAEAWRAILGARSF